MGNFQVWVNLIQICIILYSDDDDDDAGLGRSEDGVRSGNITSCNTGILDHGHCLLPAG